jgi:predicted acyl esterase
VRGRRVAAAQARRRELYFGPAGTLSWDTPPGWREPDRYTYDPQDPTPTVGGSILSAVYPPGSVDVTEQQLCTDVLTFTTEPLAHGLDVVGPLPLVLYASSTAVDTEFVTRLPDVFPTAGRSSSRPALCADTTATPRGIRLSWSRA